MSYEIDYSVVIRTLGTAGEKYDALLSSIRALEPQPREIIVVLPEGYEKPTTRLGYETFYHSPKGMVIQRAYGINMAKTKYALVCDDDVSFDRDFVQKLHIPVSEGKYSFSAGPLISFFPQKGTKSFISLIMGAAAPTLFHRERYVSVLRTAGYSYNRNINTRENLLYETQSLPWTCFFTDVDSFKKLNITEEFWLDMNGYSAYDDQTMFYKGWLMGLKAVVVSDAVYQHLDAKTSTHKNKPATVYSSVFNRYVFWHRFIYKQEKKNVSRAWSIVCFRYRTLWCKIWDVLDFIRRRSTRDDFNLSRQAYKDAKKFVKSQEYLNLSERCPIKPNK